MQAICDIFLKVVFFTFITYIEELSFYMSVVYI